MNNINNKIVLVIDHFIPEVGSAANLYHELAIEFIKRNYDVTVITNFPRNYNLPNNIKQTKLIIRSKETIDNINIKRVIGFVAKKNSLIFRGLEHFFNGLLIALTTIFEDKKSIFIVYSPPLPLACSLSVLSKIRGSKIIVNIQDLYPKTVVDLELMKNSILIKIFSIIETITYFLADDIVVHSFNNQSYILKKGISIDKVKIIHNWIDLSLIENESSFLKQSNKEIIVTYAGVISSHQGIEDIIDAASLLQNEKNIRFKIAGDGFYKDKILNYANEKKILNIEFLPYLDKKEYYNFIQKSTISIVPLSKKVKTPVVPGKLMSLMAAGVPVIASVPEDNDTKKILEESQAGLVVSAGNPNQLADAIKFISNNPNIMNEMKLNGINYAKSHFSVEIATSEFEKIFKKNKK